MFVLTHWISLSHGTWSLTPWCDRQQLDSTRTTAKTAAYSCVAAEDKHWLISNHKAGAPWTFEIFIDVSLLPEMFVCHDLTSSLNWASRRGLAAAYNVGLRIKNLLGFEIYNIYSWIHSCHGWLGALTSGEPQDMRRWQVTLWFSSSPFTSTEVLELEGTSGDRVQAPGRVQGPCQGRIT